MMSLVRAQQGEPNKSRSHLRSAFVFLSFVWLGLTRHHDCATCCAERCLRSKLAVERSETVSHGSNPAGVTQEKRPFSNGLFSIQSEGLACNLTAGEYVIAEGVWHHASACILLRIDYIQHFVLIPYRRQAADSIHGFAAIL